MRKALLHLKKSDPVMAAIIQRAGAYRMNYRPPEFGSLVRSIVYQQLNGAAAATILGRVIAAAGGSLTPAGILKVSDEMLRAAGLSRQKISYLRDLAQQTRDRRLRFNRLAGLPDDEVIAALTKVKGVGVWTAHMFLMFTLRRPNILPVGDLGVRIAIRKAYGLKDLPTPDETRELARCWDPYCSVASWYLWRSLEVAPGKTAGATPANPKSRKSTASGTKAGKGKKSGTAVAISKRKKGSNSISGSQPRIKTRS